MKASDANNIWDSDDYIYRMADGFLYGFEDEECEKTFEDHELYLWTMVIGEKFVKALRNHSFKIFVCHSIDDNLDAAGMVCYKEKVIFIQIDSGEITNSLFHELGHLVQVFTKTVKRPILEYALAKEATNFCDTLASFYMRDLPAQQIDPLLHNFVLRQMVYFLTPNEYFAEALAMVFIGWDEFEKKCPFTYRICMLLTSYFEGGKEELNAIENELGIKD